MMHAPVGHHPSRIIPEPAEARPAVRMRPEAVRVERPHWRGAQPHIPVQPVRRIAVGWRANAVGRLIAEIPCPYESYFAESPAANDLDGPLIVIAGALLGADLDHAVVFSRGLNHLATFVHRDRNGLFDVDVFAGLAGRHHL